MANEPNKSRTGVDYGGRPKAFAKPGEPTLAAHHTQDRTNEHAAHEATAHRTRHAELGPVTQYNGRTGGKPKGQMPVPVHNGMHTRSRATGALHMGGDALSRADANPANPLGGAPRGKNLTPPQPVPGQRSRTSDTVHGGAPGENHARNKPNIASMSDLGKAILAEATCSSDDAMARPDWGIGTLPPITRSK